MAWTLVLLILALLLPPQAVAAAGPDAMGPLGQRLEQWPAWSLPAPLPRPGRDDLLYPDWFAGSWQVSSPAEAGEPPLHWRARFRRDGRGRVVGERAFNAAAIGRALLGERLLTVQDDPQNPNRQLARLRDGLLLDSRVVGRRTERPDADSFLADELSLQVLHGPGEPRVSRVETLSRYRLQSDGTITGEQWQASYGSPSGGLVASAERSEQHRLRLVPAPPESDRAS
jgi:hypothetical protein